MERYKAIDKVKEMIKCLDEQAKNARNGIQAKKTFGIGERSILIGIHDKIVEALEFYTHILNALDGDDYTNYTDADTWGRYIDYLRLWTDAHADPFYCGSVPPSYDDWLDNEGLEDI